ncbi:MAG: type IX secretion system sortase PorU, partial [Bacteroidetes bacterium]|nr:type IX secretion system sortase PorU [Bacteroidota bacterium]
MTGFISVGEAQRIYKPNSVLASGNWYKIAVKKTGIYKIDLAFLNSMGISGSVSSNSIRLYGNGGQMLAEANNISRMDDLEENSIMIADGGDGVLNGSDYILFYANGPDQWLKDSANLRFSHQKNIYSDKSVYFLSIGGTGKRINSVNNTSLIPNISVTSFNDRYFHELDTVNLLGSGKDWLGEEFADAPGKTLSRNFLVTVPGATAGSATLVTNCQARSVGGSSNFSIQVNNTPVLQLSIPSITGGQYDLYSRAAQALASFIPSSGNISVTYNFSPGSFNAQGWLDWFEIFTRSNLSMSSVDQLPFRDWQSVGTNNTAEFVISAATASTQVWDVTDPLQPVQIQGNFQNGEFRFRNTSNRLREYIAFNNANFLIPEAIGKITDQDLHNSSPADLIIVTYPPFLQQAQRLAQFHQQHDTLRTVVATTDQVFNEFASGQPDPTAIRDFAKMYYDKAGGNSANQPKYLLLFGAASFDYKSRINNNTNFVPGYETSISADPLSTYTSDDFFGFLDDNEDINSGLVSNLLDVGIGRISARTIDDAKNYVDKVISYYSKESFGPWRNASTFIADDEDQDLHLQDAESIVATTTSADSILNISKIYLDAYQQVSGSGGSTYPQANEAINNQVYNGTLIWNYNGHGGSSRLAEETILDQSIVNAWNNATKLPLFITATCDFAPYDNPTIHSLGENILLRPKTGGIALLTTTRVVFAYSNRIINNNYLQFSLQRKQDGSYKTLGEALRQAKN